MTRHSGALRVPSRWDSYRMRHNTIRNVKNRAPMQRIIRSASALATKLWLNGEYATSLVETSLSHKADMTLPRGLPSAAIAQGCPLHFYDAQRAIIANGHFLRFLKSSILKRQLVVLTEGSKVHCCPALYCQLGHNSALKIPVPPAECDQCAKYGVMETSCDSCSAPRFLHV